MRDQEAGYLARMDASSQAGPEARAFDVQGWDRSPFARREFLSSDIVEWPALLIEEVASNANVDDATIPASNDFQIVLVIGGDARIESLSDRLWRRARYVPGQVSLTPAGRSSCLRWRSAPDKAPRTLHAIIPASTMAAAYAHLSAGATVPDAMPDYLAVTDPVIESSIRSLRTAAARRLDPLYAESAAWHLAVHILATDERHLTDTPAVHDTRIAAVVDFVHDNLGEPLSLTDMAEVAGSMSPFHFLRSFQATMGRTPYQYVIDTRLVAARRLLANTSTPVSDIALRCGFSTPSHFAATFRRQFGTTPSHYRAELARR